MGDEHSPAAFKRDDLVEGVESPAAAAVVGTDVWAVSGDGAEDWDVVKGVNPCCDLNFRVPVGGGEDEKGVIKADDRVPHGDGVWERAVPSAAGAALQLALEEVRGNGVRETEGVLFAMGRALVVGLLEFDRVPIAQGDWVLGGGVEGRHVDVVLVAKDAGVEDGGS